MVKYVTVVLVHFPPHIKYLLSQYPKLTKTGSFHETRSFETPATKMKVDFRHPRGCQTLGFCRKP